jgi:hypothetical protein
MFTGNRCAVRGAAKLQTTGTSCIVACAGEQSGGGILLTASEFFPVAPFGDTRRRRRSAAAPRPTGVSTTTSTPANSASADWMTRFVWSFEAFWIRSVCGDDTVHDSENPVDTPHDVLGLRPFLRPLNTAGERYRPAIDMYAHFMRHAGMIVKGFSSC